MGIKLEVRKANSVLIEGDYPYRLVISHFVRLEKKYGSEKALVFLAQCKRYLGIEKGGGK